jgi:cellulose 1,4-beta-cellobiosidase
MSANNPFAQRRMFVNPEYQKNIDSSLATSKDATTIKNLKAARNAPTAVWLDVASKVKEGGYMAQILAKASSKLVVFVVYDLPNRDCAARASNGEICCKKNVDGSCNYLSTECSSGLKQYKSYIDNIAARLAKYPSVPVALVLEPDSLPNLVTNLGMSSCGSAGTQSAYKDGILYAVEKLGQRATLYLDAGHGGWLGWDNNRLAFKSLLDTLGVVPKIRGFATNVAGYQPLGQGCRQVGWCLGGSHPADACCADACNLVQQWNPANNEVNYVLALSQSFPNARFIIDTGRSGIPNARTNCANWCNPRATGFGKLPTNKTSNSLIDAYLWIKVPGESDGCTQQLPNGANCPRFDGACASVDSIGSRSGEPRAPEAGKWFDYQVKMLAKNARF